MRVKKTADVRLTETDLDWVIVRPGTLTDDPGNGRVSVGPALEYGDVSRDNVASFIAAVLRSPTSPELSSSSPTGRCRSPTRSVGWPPAAARPRRRPLSGRDR